MAFGRVLADTVFCGAADPMESLMNYFESPHKWETECQKWRELGGTLDMDCLRAFEDWYDNKDLNDEEAE